MTFHRRIRFGVQMPLAASLGTLQGEAETDRQEEFVDTSDATDYGRQAHYRGGLVSIPRHAGETLDPKLVGWILNQADLTVEELKELL
jgi:hypothetical protein